MKASSTLLLAVAVGCAGCSLKPKLVRHYESLATDSTNATLSISASGVPVPSTAALMRGSNYSVSAFVTAVPPKQPPGPFVASLADHGQGALIEALGTAGKSPTELLELLAKPAPKPEQACAPVGPLRLERRLVISLTGRHTLPANRFDAMAYTVWLNQGTRAFFYSWNRFETLYDTVSLGSTRMKQSQSVGLAGSDSDKSSLAASAGVPGHEAISALNLTANMSRELEENVISARRFTPVTGSLSKERAAIVQQGAVGLDLFGNLTADFTVEIPDAASEWILSTKGLMSAGDKPEQDLTRITSTWCPRVYASSVRPLEAELDATAILRYVSRGETTAIEGDDVASFQTISASSPAKLELVGTSDLQRDLFKIGKSSEYGTLYLGSSDKYRGGEVRFSSFEQARDFVRWLRGTGKPSPIDLTLSWPGAAVGSSTPWANAYQPADAATMKVYLCRDEASGKQSCGPVWQ